MSGEDVGLIFAKLLVVENEVKNLTKNLDDHNAMALKRQTDYSNAMKIIVDRLDCQNTRCFSHAPIIDGFGKHLKEHDELKMEQGKRFFTLLIAMGGWSLALIELCFKLWKR